MGETQNHWDDARPVGMRPTDDEVSVGRIRLGGPFFLAVSAWRSGFGAVPSVYLQVWQDVRRPDDTPAVSCRRQKLYVPLDVVGEVGALMQAAAATAGELWRKPDAE